MPKYIRPKVEAATVFFTVALAQRGGDVLLRHIDHLRGAVRQVIAEKPFQIDAWVVLPDHLHAIWTLPQGDRDRQLVDGPLASVAACGPGPGGGPPVRNCRGRQTG